MPDVLLTFTDGEVLRATAPMIDFHTPVLQVVATEPGGNNREITVPLTSLKYIVFGGEEESEWEPEEAMGKVVIHFTDHEVMRAYAGRNVLGGPLGIIYTLLDPQKRIRRQIGVPYTAVKAIFKVKVWDSREKVTGPTYARVARILSDREEQLRAERVGRGRRQRPTPLLDRFPSSRRRPRGNAEPDRP